MYICDNISLGSSDNDKWFRQMLKRKYKKKTHFMINKHFSKNRAIYDKMWYSGTGHRGQYNTARTLWILDT
jgi:hypothetical protein